MPQENIFKSARHEREIFKNEQALLPDYLPPELPGREREIRELAHCLKPALEGRQPDHAFLYGPPGTGKTTCARFVLSQLSEHSSRALPIYINCWEFPSRFAVLSLVASALGEALPRRGVSADEIRSRAFEIAKKEGRILAVVLDEADRLEASSSGAGALYDLCRAGETHSIKISVIAITNDLLFHAKLDPRVRSSFLQHTLHFKPYTVPQLKEIISQRASAAFADGALEPDVVPLCAAMAFKSGGDARYALHLLHAAGKAAEREGSPSVSVSHVRTARKPALSYAKTKAERKDSELGEEDKAIVEAVRKAGPGGIESGRLYLELSHLGGERAIRQRVSTLEKAGILATEEIQLGRGRSRLIKLKKS